MRYYFAPMEGITDSIYRRTHHKYFGGVDRYYMPFLSPSMHQTLTAREQRELPPADSENFVAVPQILTKVAEDFLWAAQVCRDRGYDEVNLNTGCPSGTVVAKGKGAGMLRDPGELDRFLDAIFEKCPIPISVKTRLGLENAEEFIAILEVFNSYPIKELTVHPRVRKDFYKEPVRPEWYDYARKNSKNPLCCNGDILSKKQADALCADAVMIGRSLVGDPGMLCGGTDNKTLEEFMAELMEQYSAAFGSARNTMFRMKENWGMLRPHFPDCEKLFKQLMKTTDTDTYRAITAEILQNHLYK